MTFGVTVLRVDCDAESAAGNCCCALRLLDISTCKTIIQSERRKVDSARSYGDTDSSYSAPLHQCGIGLPLHGHSQTPSRPL